MQLQWEKTFCNKKTQSYQLLNAFFKSNVTIFNTEIYSTCLVQCFNSDINYFKRKKECTVYHKSSYSAVSKIYLSGVKLFFKAGQ